MKTRYKNKRDFYKAEAERLKIDAERMRIKLDSYVKQEADHLKEKQKMYPACVYCRNCMEVHQVLIPPGVSIEQSNCINCKVHGTSLPVRSYPGWNGAF